MLLAIMIIYYSYPVVLCDFLGSSFLFFFIILHNLVNLSCRFPIIEPDPGHTKLRLARAGLEAIERVTTPVAAVAVRFR